VRDGRGITIRKKGVEGESRQKKGGEREFSTLESKTRKPRRTSDLGSNTIDDTIDQK